MSDVLERICAEKRAYIARLKAEYSEAKLVDALAEAPPARLLCCRPRAAFGARPFRADH